MSAFLYRRGKGVKRRVAHLAMYNRHGEIVGPWCQRRVNLDTVRAIAEAGVDLISVGALTHSATVLDVGLDIEIEPTA